MTDRCAHGYEDGKCTMPWCEYSEALEASRHKAAFVAERKIAEEPRRLDAVVTENNALRKNTEKLTVQLKETREALARAQGTASKASCRAEDFASALRSQRATHTLELDAEWNAALEKAAGMVETAPPSYNRNDHADRIRTLKREVKT